MMRLLPMVLTFHLALGLCSFASELPRGEVVEAVPVPGVAGQSYAAYLPKSFRADREWPILYVFDPMARGTLAVGLFARAAERHGWIVVASNNARNGPRAPLRAAVEAVWNDTRARLPIASRRVYFAGMSGGTGPAWDMGKAFGAGVISCGGPRRTERETFALIPFPFYALAGDGDFNYGPMREMALGVLEGGGEARFDVFSGGHGWAPAEALGEAVDWLELLAMRDGLVARDEDFLRTIYERTLARAQGLETTNAHHAALLYASMVRDFAGVLATDFVAAAAKRAVESKAARKAEKAEKRLVRREAAEYARLVGLRRAMTQTTPAAAPPLRPETEPDWSGLPLVLPRDVLLEEIERHRRQMAKADRSDDTLLSQRVFDSARVSFIEAAREASREGRWRDAALDLDLAVAMRPESGPLRIQLAQALVEAGEKRRALATLREAVERRLVSAELLRTTEALALLRGEAELERIIAAAAVSEPGGR